MIDTETRVDPTQALTFGSYRYCRWDGAQLRCVAEGLFYADELPREDPTGYAVLKRYARRTRANVVAGGDPDLQLLARAAFIERVFFPSACGAGAIICGFNLPFDLSRLAVECGEARGRFYGGFSFSFANYRDDKGRVREDTYYARVAIRSLDSKRAFMGFVGGRERHKGKGVAGRFLDLRTLTFALTNVSHSLASACRQFGVMHGKQRVARHGDITAAYIAYNRRDVLATQELLEQLRGAFDVHPIALDPCKAFSPASIAKAYLAAFGVAKPSTQFPQVSDRARGIAMTAYFGGRAEVRIRKTPVPVIYTDFLSMYPTVNALLDLWPLLTAARVDVVDDTDCVRQLLGGITADACFRRETWPDFRFYAEIDPDRDILPARGRYSAETDAWNIGVNPVSSDCPLWYAGPDLVASTLLTGRPPRIRQAFRLVPVGRQSTLVAQKLGNEVGVDPHRDDLFRIVIEARKNSAARQRMSDADAARLDQFLKILANSGSYGVFAEVNATARPKKAKKARLVVFGRERAFVVHTSTPEEPGPYCFPPIAALIPSAARLMLALLETEVRRRGGEFVLCDTDSMAIVATKAGGPVPCPGGPRRSSGGRTIHSLRWQEVDEIAERFRDLSPYRPDRIVGSILKIEAENSFRGRRRQLWAYAISAKRYALFTCSPASLVTVVRYSEHGLGHLLNPSDVEGGTDWMREVWQFLVESALGRHPKEPAWMDRPAISRTRMTAPPLYTPFAHRSVPYRDRLKPFNFALTAHVAPLGHPSGVDPTHFQLIAPFERNASKWLRMLWSDVHSGKTYRISTTDGGASDRVRVKSYRRVLEGYASHPEPKSVAAVGGAGRRAQGLLARRAVVVTTVGYVGKESNKIDDIEAGLVHAINDVQLEVVSPDGTTRMSSNLRRLPVAALARHTGLSARHVVRLRSGLVKPTAEVVARLSVALRMIERRLLR